MSARRRGGHPLGKALRDRLVDKDGWLTQSVGKDGRERVVALGTQAREALPRLQRHWRATAGAAADLDAELGLSLEDILRRALTALAARPFHARMAPATPPRKRTAPAGGQNL